MVEASKGRIRADVVHERLAAMGVRRWAAHDAAGDRAGEDGVPVDSAAVYRRLAHAGMKCVRVRS
jgi:hypothetical protein